MKFFSDTADLNEIKELFSLGVNDGITTNPMIMKNTGDLRLGFEQACKKIISYYPNVPISLETDLKGIDPNNIEKESNKVKDKLISQGKNISNYGKNVVVKIPICSGGIEAVRELEKQGIKTNVTACMTPYQAIKSANAGASYVSLFANRMLDSHILELAGHNLESTITEENDWKSLVQKEKEKYLEQAWELTLNEISYVAKSLENTKSQLIVGSIRTPEDIYRIVKASPQVITIPTLIAKHLDNVLNLKQTPRTINGKEVYSNKSVFHPMTTYTIKEFEMAAKSYQ